MTVEEVLLEEEELPATNLSASTPICLFSLFVVAALQEVVIQVDGATVESIAQ